MSTFKSTALKTVAACLLATAFFVAGNMFANSQVEASDAPLYELYPTQNMFNFLKLNTKTGVVTKVQYAINNDDARFESNVNSIPLVSDYSSENGRFKLCPTQNFYTFLLLDQETGRVWQLQWSNEPEKCGIVDEIK